MSLYVKRGQPQTNCIGDDGDDDDGVLHCTMSILSEHIFTEILKIMDGCLDCHCLIILIKLAFHMHGNGIWICRM